MASINKVILIGNLGQDPEKRVTGSGQVVCNFSVATTDRWNDREGQKQERTEWHRVVVWGAQAETCAQYLSKGRQAYIEGRLQTREWEDKEGNKRYTTEVVAQRVLFLGGPRGADDQSSYGKKPSAGAEAPSGVDAGPDDIPF